MNDPVTRGGLLPVARVAPGGPARLPALTGLRFVLAAYVVVYHFARMFLSSAPAPIYRLVLNGFVGVGLFFTLSGFILAYTYLGSAAPLDRSQFLVARVARVYPVYLLSWLLAAPFTVADLLRTGPLLPGLAKAAIAGATSLSLTQSLFPWTALVWNGPGWSLSVEAMLYLSFPFVAPAVSRLSVRGQWRLLAVAWLLALTPPIIYAVLYPADFAAIKVSSFSSGLSLLKFHPLWRVPEFVGGIALGCLFARHRPAPHRALAVLGMLAAAATTACVAFVPVPLLLAHNGLYLPLFWVLIWSLAAGAGPLARLLASRVLEFLGEASYALYILQLPLFLLVARLIEPDGGESAKSSTPLRFALYCLVAIAASSATLVFVERPARILVRRLLSRVDKC